MGPYFLGIFGRDVHFWARTTLGTRGCKTVAFDTRGSTNTERTRARAWRLRCRLALRFRLLFTVVFRSAEDRAGESGVVCKRGRGAKGRLHGLEKLQRSVVQ